MDDLSSRFADSSVTAVYASHVLEHGSYALPRKRGEQKEKGPHADDDSNRVNAEGVPVLTTTSAAAAAAKQERLQRMGMFGSGEVASALVEWRRVLAPGGLLMVAVPDLPTLLRLYLGSGFEERVFLMRVIYGGQVDEYDFHHTGFEFMFLEQLLHVAGFCAVSQVEGPFGLFQDTSVMQLLGADISLNVAAVACGENLEMGGGSAASQGESKISSLMPEGVKLRAITRLVFALSGVGVPEEMKRATDAA
jgi:predicted SAM-dependent methyltransferase